MWFDAHLDLAYLAVSGRDMLSPSLETCGGPDLPAAVTLPSLREGHVSMALATIFTEPDGNPSDYAYASGDRASANRAGRRQLDIYQDWVRRGLITLAGSTWEPGPNLSAWILMEGADPILEPSELDWWVDHGVRAIGLAWARPSRYAGGNMVETGLTDLGRDLIRRMDAKGVIHDLSHLSDAAADELLSMSTGRVIASHSNCRAIVASSGALATGTGAATTSAQLHLRDETIIEIARRGGVIGLNLFSPFLIPGGSRDRRATIAEALAHVERVCELVGHKQAVMLGSDMDGGFSAAKMPTGINQPRDLNLLLDALSARGWSNDELRGFACRNWLDFVGRG
jgi:membrane dipeptidase